MLFCFQRELPELCRVAHGGLVETARGWDIRFEDRDGVKLPHIIDRWNGERGFLTAWVRIPTLTPGRDNDLFLYVGNKAVTATEADPAATAVDYIAWWNTLTGIDYTGKPGRSLTVAGNPRRAVGIGVGARFDGVDDQLSLDPGDWFGGWSALTIRAVCKPDEGIIGQTRGLIVKGPDDARGSECSLAMYFRPSNTAGTVANPILVNVTCGAAAGQRAFFVSSANQQEAVLQVLTATWASGREPQLYKSKAGSHGELVPASGSASAPARLDPLTGTLRVGRGVNSLAAGFPEDGPWKGLIDEMRLRDSVMTADHIATEDFSLLDPAAFFKLGSFEDNQPSHEIKPSQPAYDFLHKLPWPLPAADEDIVFLDVPATGRFKLPVGDTTTWNKVLVLVPPATELTTVQITTRNDQTGKEEPVKWGGIIAVGFNWQRIGPATAPGTQRKISDRQGGNFIEISTASGAEAFMPDKRRPYIWLSNHRINMVSSHWGDFCRHGTVTVGNPPTNMAGYHDFYMQKMHFDNGHLNWDAATGEATRTHSDILQSAKGAANNITICDCNFVWNGLGIYTLDTGNIQNKPHLTKSPQGARFNFENISYRNMVDPSGIDNGTWYVHTQSRDAGVWNIADGLWRAMRIKNVKFFLSEDHPKRARPASAWRTPNYPTAESKVGDGKTLVQWTPQSGAGRVNGDLTVMEEMEAEMVASEADLPQMVDPAHTGAEWRITSVDDLRSIFSSE